MSETPRRDCGADVTKLPGLVSVVDSWKGIKNGAKHEADDGTEIRHSISFLSTLRRFH
jgi:hypothetical protein